MIDTGQRNKIPKDNKVLNLNILETLVEKYS